MKPSHTPTSASGRGRSRGSLAALVVLVVTLLLATGCGGGEDPVVVPAGLLSATAVGGVPIAGAVRLTHNAGPDSTALLVGNRNEVAGYRRDGELVLVSAKERAASLVESATADMLDCLERRDCSSERTDVQLTMTRLHAAEAQLHDTTIAFSSVFTYEDEDGAPKRISTLRSYTYLQPDPNFDGTLVMVSLERTGKTDPDQAELLRLTRAQVAKTEATMR